MSLFAIADLHLSFAEDKPMNVFGDKWNDYEFRLQKQWNDLVQKDDTVIICGDISWATYISRAEKDFSFIDSLNGKKIILKGNHDYWWTTLSKMNKFLAENEFKTISFLQNNSFEIDGLSICGSRGWMAYAQCENGEDKKIYRRELERLELSLKSAKTDEKLVALHYPPDSGFIELMKKYNVERCIFGHLHAASLKNPPQGIILGVEHLLVSCDYLDFCPKMI